MAGGSGEAAVFSLRPTIQPVSLRGDEGARVEDMWALLGAERWDAPLKQHVKQALEAALTDEMLAVL